MYDGSGALIARFDGAKMTVSGTDYYLLTDQVGSVTAVVDATGTVVKTVEEEPVAKPG